MKYFVQLVMIRVILLFHSTKALSQQLTKSIVIRLSYIVQDSLHALSLSLSPSSSHDSKQICFNAGRCDERVGSDLDCYKPRIDQGSKIREEDDQLDLKPSWSDELRPRLDSSSQSDRSEDTVAPGAPLGRSHIRGSGLTQAIEERNSHLHPTGADVDEVRQIPDEEQEIPGSLETYENSDAYLDSDQGLEEGEDLGQSDNTDPEVGDSASIGEDLGQNDGSELDQEGGDSSSFEQGPSVSDELDQEGELEHEN